jgi:hypothetical protein
MSTSAQPTPDQIEQWAKIIQALTDAARKRQEMRYAPFLAAFAGMTSGAALFAAGIAFSRFFLAGAP